MKGMSKAIRKGREHSVYGSFSAPERSRPFDVLSIKNYLSANDLP